MTGSARIIRGNALALPLADASVDLCVTSPPYFGLRSYQDGGEHYAGQIGSEATPAEFVDALIAATREMVRVLKPSGSIFVNLGDKYAGSQPGSYRRDTQPLRDSRRSNRSHQGTAAQQRQSPDVVWGSAPTKSLLGIPWRYALRCIDELGLILRAEIIWAKPNGLPESVTDRVRRSHEQWFHMVKQPRYYSAVDEIREEHAERRLTKDGANNVIGYRRAIEMDPNRGTVDQIRNPLGKLPGSVWTIPTQPLTVPPELGVDHFAAFPMEWPRRIIAGWSPTGICTVCGEGRRIVTDRKPMLWRPGPSAGNYEAPGATRVTPSGTMLAPAETRIIGYGCDCGQAKTPGSPAPREWLAQESSATTLPPTRPATVLDPFGGTGTVSLVASVMGRIGISVDMSADYCRLAEWRTTDPGQMAAALQVERPEPVSPDQLDLFSEAL